MLHARKKKSRILDNSVELDDNIGDSGDIERPLLSSNGIHETVSSLFFIYLFITFIFLFKSGSILNL